MKYIYICLFIAIATVGNAQHNPRVVGIDLTPDNSPGRALSVYDCGQVMSSTFNFSVAGITDYPVCGGGIIMTISILNWSFVDQSVAANNISDNLGWKSLFSWSFSGSQTIVATQIGSIPSTGPNPLNPIQTKFEVALQVPLLNSLNGSPLGIQVQLSSIPQVPGSCSGNNTGDDANTTNGTVFCNRSLPIQKFELNAVTNENNTNKLLWMTLNEINTLEFEIQRKYSNEETWMAIGKTPAAGQSSKELSYQYNDLTYVNRDKIYYRIKQIDVNGQSNYTDIKSIDLKRNSQVKLDGYPNPVKNFYHLTIIGAKDDKVSIDVYDILGRSVSRKTLSIVKGSNYHDLNMGTYTPGTYIVRVSSAEINESMTVVKVD